MIWKRKWRQSKSNITVSKEEKEKAAPLITAWQLFAGEGEWTEPSTSIRDPGASYSGHLSVCHRPGPGMGFDMKMETATRWTGGANHKVESWMSDVWHPGLGVDQCGNLSAQQQSPARGLYALPCLVIGRPGMPGTLTHMLRIQHL